MNNTNQKFKQLLIILLTLFIFIFFTRDYYSNLIGNLDLKKEKEEIYKQKTITANNLSKIQNDFKSGKQNKYSSDIKKYNKTIKENEIINFIYGMAETRINGDVKITSVSISKGVKNELGFYESKLNITALVQDKTTIKEIFNYLNNNKEYKIFINSFNLPRIKTPVGYKITIPATIFYVNLK